MSNGGVDPRRLPFFHHASAFGVSGEIHRPFRQIIPVQANAVLPATGGHNSHRVDKYHANGISFDSAQVEVGGSFDEQHNAHATYAYSVVENLNIMDVVRADRIVCRLSLYFDAQSPDQLATSSPGPRKTGNKKRKRGASTAASGNSTTTSMPVQQPSFFLSGSHFENLKINGQPVDVQLGAAFDTKYDTYNKVRKEYHSDKKSLCLFGEDIPATDQLKTNGFLEHNAELLGNVAAHFTRWTQRSPSGQNPESNHHTFWCSAVDSVGLKKCVDGLKGSTAGCGLEAFGGIIAVPRFGIIFLGELIIRNHHRHFHMIRVEMGSPTGGNITSGGGTGGSMPPGG